MCIIVKSDQKVQITNKNILCYKQLCYMNKSENNYLYEKNK